MFYSSLKMYKEITQPGTFINPGSIYSLRVTKFARLERSYYLMHLQQQFCNPLIAKLIVVVYEKTLLLSIFKEILSFSTYI